MSQSASRELNPWRQGCLIDSRHALSHGWLTAEDGEILLIVATHDCDLQSSAVSDIELLRARFVEQVSGDRTNGKNPRTLQLPDALGRSGALEVTNEKALRVPKHLVMASIPTGSLIDQDRRHLASWLATRYKRAPFPDSFDQRLKKARTVDSTRLKDKDVARLKKDRSLAKQLMSVFTADGAPIEGVYVGLKGRELDELDPKSAYSLVIVVVARSGRQVEEDTRLALATGVAAKIRGLFDHASWDDSVGAIALDSCTPSTELDFSLYYFRRMLRWHLDWLSGDVIDDGGEHA